MPTNRSYLTIQHRKKRKRHYIILNCQGDDHWEEIVHRPLSGVIHFDVQKGEVEVKLGFRQNGQYRRRYRLDLSRYL